MFSASGSSRAPLTQEQAVAPNCQVLRQQEPTPATCPSRISSARAASPSSVILAAPKAMMRVVPSSSGTRVKLPLGTGPLNSQSLGMSSDHVQIAAVWFGTSRPFIMTGSASLTTRLPVPFETSAHVHVALPPPYTVTAQDRGFEKSKARAGPAVTTINDVKTLPNAVAFLIPIAKPSHTTHSNNKDYEIRALAHVLLSLAPTESFCA
jgi:hypothetical protein